MISIISRDADGFLPLFSHSIFGTPRKRGRTSRLFRTSAFGATIERYREIHQLTEQLGRWPTVQSELLASVKQSHTIPLQIEIALDAGQVKEALDLLQSQAQPENLRNGPYEGNTFEVGIKVAQAAEENYLQEAIEIYQKYVETRIAWRGRDHYRIACQYLVKVRRLFQRIGKSRIITTNGKRASLEPL